MPFFGVCYAPYHRRNDRSGVTESEVDADMAIISSRNFTHIRTYSAEDGDQWNVDKAAKRGLTIALGIWIDDNDQSGDVNRRNIDHALQQAQAAAANYGGNPVIDLVVGNEVDKKRLTPTTVYNLMQYAKEQKPRYSNVTARVTTCFTGTALQNSNSPWLNVVDYCESVVYLTVYPWFGNAKPDDINPQMEWSWNNGLRQVQENNKEIVIAEIGWPSAGGRDTSIANEQTNYAVTKKWVSGGSPLGRNFDTFWFEMFDEPWKIRDGPQEPHWGLYTSGEDPQPKFPF
jgi:exo-beta-1,3-glucanase (GH17 family)